MKMFLILILLSIFSYSTHSKDSDFSKLGCNVTSFNMFNRWIIKSKLDQNNYDVLITESRFRAPPKRALIELNSIQYDSKGEIADYIFIKELGTKKMKTQDGFDIDVTLYKESPECKLIWLSENPSAQSTFVKMSYPRMPKIEKKHFERKRKLEVEKPKKVIQTPPKKVNKEEIKKQERIKKKSESLYE